MKYIKSYNLVEAIKNVIRKTVVLLLRLENIGNLKNNNK